MNRDPAVPIQGSSSESDTPDCAIGSRRGRRLLAALFLLPVWLSAEGLAQGCASCYTSAAAGGPQTAHALRSGILLLLLPPALIFAGIVAVARRWKILAPEFSRADREEQPGSAPDAEQAMP